MTVVTTVEGGEALVERIISADLRLILITGGNSGALTKLADVFGNQPSDGWYSEIALPQANWFGTGDTRQFAQQTFISDAGSTVVTAHCIYSAADGAIILLDEYAAPVSMTPGQQIAITPILTVA